MDTEQFAKYLELVDHPAQLALMPEVASLYIIYREHVTRFPYQNLDLYLGKPLVDLSVSSLLETLPLQGGHCFQQSELMLAVLEYMGFKVERVAAWVLMGNKYQEGMPLNHNILLVKIGEDTYLCDPGLASASPRFPIKLNMESTEEVTISEGDMYKLEVEEKFYQLHWMMKGSYLLMYRFARSTSTGLAEISDRESTLELCKNVYNGPGFIPIRDKYVKVALQTHDSKIDFFFVDGSYTLKIFTKGRPREEKTLDYKQFFQLLKEMCNLEFEAVEIVRK
eukprot:TRINITY_DN21940_c0_g1_i1.p1 TRINITY_DN21940_c0_g1~~TRINITY_DN21940_c0_g1_i1.p1  ORF type:complete len:294 (+),score=84.58 TRINITY_DN21940_c0_g1_i1:43-882(+)